MSGATSSQLLQEYLSASQAVYLRTGQTPVSVPGLTPLVGPDGNNVVSASNADGFYGAAYVDAYGNIIIACEGSLPASVSAYGYQSGQADYAILEQRSPAVLADARAFAGVVLSDAQTLGISQSRVYVTGHSLGGVEAEAISSTYSLGGATFGAPGLPGYAKAGPQPNLVNYVAYGDPVGNYASDDLTEPGYAPTDHMDHVGTVQLVGNAASTYNLTAASSLFGFAEAKGASGSAHLIEIAGLLFTQKYHDLSNYSNILGLSLPTPFDTLPDNSELMLGIDGLYGSNGARDFSSGNLTGSGADASSDFNISTNSDGSVVTIVQNVALSSGGADTPVADPGTDVISFDLATSNVIREVFNDSITGTATEIIPDLASIDDGQNISFSGNLQTLVLENAGNYLGTISDFGLGDTIDLVGVVTTGGTIGTDGKLTVKTTGAAAINFTFSGVTSPETVYAVSDGNGGTDLTLTEPVPVTTAPTLEIVTQGQVAGVSGISVAVPGGLAFNEILNAVLADGSGLLGASQVNGGTVTGSGTTLLTLTGSLDAINAELATVTYTGTVANSSDLIDVRTTNDQGQGDDHQIGVQVDGPTAPPITLPIELPPGQTIPVSGLGGATVVPTATDNSVGQSVIDIGLVGFGEPISSVGYSWDIANARLTYTLIYNNGAAAPTIETFYVDDVERLLSSGTLNIPSPLPEAVYQYQASVGNGLAAHEYLIVTSSEISLACFPSGTNIATRLGEVPVEKLAVGDLVQTRAGHLQPVKWIGHRRVDCRRHPKPEDVWPVRIMAGAFGPGLPHRDLWLSPDHAVFAEGVLIPVKYLINGSTIAQEARDQVTYWHVELDQHDVLIAEGLPCESYLDTGTRSSFANGGSLVQMHADFGGGTYCEAVWEGVACAPLRIEGPAVHRVVTRLRRRARELGLAQRGRQRRASPVRRIKPTCDLAALVQPGWYLANHPDVAAAGVDPTMHYIKNGRHEGRLPCSEIDLIRALGLVDSAVIIFTMPDVIAAGVDPVEHFCTTGWRERRRPNPYFDTGWYLDSYDVPPGMNPLAHYVLFGERLGYRPCEHFDPRWYAERYALGASVSALAHYLRHRRKQRVSPLPSFDVAAYRRAHAAAMRRDCDPYAHFLAVGQFLGTDQGQAASLAA